MTSVEDLTIKNDYGETALSLVAGGGITRVAKPLFPELAIAILKEHPSGTLNTLATRNSTFPSGTQLVFNFVLIAVPYIKHVYVIKLKHAQVLELLDCISQHISALNHSQIKDIELFQAIFNAIKHGNVEFVKEILTAYPDIEVEKVVQPLYGEIQNDYGKTARPLFTSKHKKLRKEWEKWMKETSTSCTVVATLITTAMFTAIFTVLGGYKHKKLRKEWEKWMKETSTSCTVVATLIATAMFTAIFTVLGGYNGTTRNPVYLHRHSFMVFTVADALSMFISCSPVQLFLGILKLRYADSEFLVSLPRKLIMAIASLFFSIVTMKLTFGTTIFISLHHR
ncbi:uncharacterized protein LOC114293685 [Camellia sinensis]|uniref:uncharacterized protein LOC114293685 n=1 Tax=Camellia sinensis TaxID=4442 RepID=UPI001036D2FF|nr:uncharacterized protein LOC114293685 [Camellia sinensis]